MTLPPKESVGAGTPSRERDSTGLSAGMNRRDDRTGKQRGDRMSFRTILIFICATALTIATGCGPKSGTTGGNGDSPGVGSSSKSQNASPGALANGDAAGPVFREVAKASGLNYEWRPKGTRPLNILGTIGNGCAFLDYDNDGKLDILLVGSSVALFQGDGAGHFKDVTAETNLATLKGYFLGCTVGDYDNDGYDDIYLTAYRGGALLHNRKGQGYEDVSVAAGIPAHPWSCSAAFTDINGDGYLDLFIGGYVKFGPDTDPQLCTNNGHKTSCGPRFYQPETSHLYLGGPNGKFKDITQSWNAHLVEGKTLGVATADYDGAGKISLALANDEMPGDLLANRGGKFENIGKNSGTAYDENGGVHGGMGVDWGDYDNDGRIDLVVATFQNEPKNIYHNDGDDLFTDKSAMLGMAPATPSLTFGIKWLDFNNDGYLDLILANGHVQDNISDIDKTTTYKQSVQLFQNHKGERFEDISASSLDEGSRRPIVGRGLATGDYDNDGKIDVLIVDSEGTPLLLHNETVNAGNALAIRLVGSKANRNGYGARVEVTVGGQKMLRQCSPCGSYMSSSDSRVHFGLGSATVADTVTVHWPNGASSALKNVPANKPLTVREDGAPK